MTLVPLGEGNVARLRDQVAQHRLDGRIAGLFALTPAVTEFDLANAFARTGPVVDAFLATARRAIAAGADIVIPAEGVLNELLASAGIRLVDEVPVLDAVATVMAHAEMMIALHRRVGLKRIWRHPSRSFAVRFRPLKR
nr:hypothetical protein [Sphingobium sp. LB126]